MPNRDIHTNHTRELFFAAQQAVMVAKAAIETSKAAWKCRHLGPWAMENFHTADQEALVAIRRANECVAAHRAALDIDRASAK